VPQLQAMSILIIFISNPMLMPTLLLLGEGQEGEGSISMDLSWKGMAMAEEAEEDMRAQSGVGEEEGQEEDWVEQEE
jgi:hypothetical protein